MKEKLLLIGYRAYGDWLYSAPLLPYLFEHYEVHADINLKGWELFHDDPRFKSISICELENYAKEDMQRMVFDRWKELERQIKPDKILNLWRTLETSCIAERYQPVFHESTEHRRNAFGDKNFYEAIINKAHEAGIPVPEMNRLGTEGLYFTNEQIAWANRWRDSHKNDFVVIMPIAGSCSHKVWPDMIKFSYEILDKYPNAYIYLTGDESVAHAQWEHPRIRKACGNAPVKQVFLMTKYADLVIGGETGTVVAAGMWGTPKIMLNTASSVWQCHEHQKNDFSLQSDIECSPCHKAIYTQADCEHMIDDGEDIYPACIMKHNYNKILGITQKIYDTRNIYNAEYFSRFAERAKSSIGKRLYNWRWDLVEKYCHGNMTLLDYGCASGAFHKATRNGFDCHGFDVNPHAGYNKLPDKKIDILTMWDVIEHLKDPFGTLVQIDADWLFISTPNAKKANGDLENWKHYRPDEHLWHFTPDDMKEELGKIGYKIVETNYGEGFIRDPEAPENIMTVVACRK